MLFNGSSFIKAWFVLDAVLALFPPFYWSVNRHQPLLDVPATLAYFLLVSFCITASVVAAYLVDQDRESLQ